LRSYRPLRGLRIISFEVAATLPSCTRIFADLGAEIVRVGQPLPARGEYLPTFEDLAINKARLSINLKNEEGRALATRLIGQADAVCSNFTPPVLRRWGFDYASLQSIRPGIVFFQLSGFGTPGPWQDFPAYGPIIQAVGGLNATTGREEDPPVRVGSHHFTDQVAGRYAALALVAAIAHRQKTGEGQYIDLSMYAAACHIIGDIITESAALGHAPDRIGNRDPAFAPQGVYRCLGDDEWIAISVVTDDQWRLFRDLVADPSLATSSLENMAERQSRHAQIDAAIEGWTQLRTRDENCALVRSLGIPVAPVQKASDILVDPELEARGTFQKVRHQRPIMGYSDHPHLTLAWRVEGQARPCLTEAHGHGADNARVLKKWLNLSSRDLSRLAKAGALLPELPIVVGDEPMLGIQDWPLHADFDTRLGLTKGG